MQALVYTDIQTLIYREEKDPKLLNGESIIKVSASGICGSDMHAYHGNDNRRIPPLILGHEISGVINKGKEIGSLEWIEYRELKKGPLAFKEIHDGSCAAPKIILLI